jgi:hypothetical protein
MPTKVGIHCRITMHDIMTASGKTFLDSPAPLRYC